jgi:hypothetical protein
MRKAVRRLVWIFGALALAALVALTALWIVLVRGPFTGEAFSPELWQTVWACEGFSQFECEMRRAACPRGPMVADLLAHHLPSGGSSRPAVTALLGSPDIEGALRLNGVRHDRCAEWLVGMCSGFGIDWDTLYVCHDAQGRIAAAGHLQH